MNNITLIKDVLAAGLNSQYREDLIKNFKIIEDAINQLTSSMKNDTPDEIVKKQDFVKELKDFRDDIEKEIRMIIAPEDDVRVVNGKLTEAMVDFDGKQHDSFKETLEANFAIFKREIQLPSNNAIHDPNESGNENDKLSIGKSGLISYDYLKNSGIKNVKQIGIVGDSVAAGVKAKYNFGDILGNNAGATVQNVSVSGAKMSAYDNNAIPNQAHKLNGCDLIIIQGTDDDWVHNIGLNAYMSGLENTVATIKYQNPNAKLLFVLATRQTIVSNGKITRTENSKNNLGLTLMNYMNAEIEYLVGNNYPYVDLAHSNGTFDPSNPAFRKLLMDGGLHPKELGHEYIAQKIAQSYYWFYG